MQTHIILNKEVRPLTPSNLELAIRTKLQLDLDKLYGKLDRAKKPFIKMVYRSRIAELNLKLSQL